MRVVFSKPQNCPGFNDPDFRDGDKNRMHSHLNNDEIRKRYFVARYVRNFQGSLVGRRSATEDEITVAVRPDWLSREV